MSVPHKPEPPDGRPISSLRFGLTETGRQVEVEMREGVPGTGVMVPEVIIDEKLAAEVRDVFEICGAVIAQDIIELGCTGLAAHNISIEVAQRIRLGLAGSGIGLVCYVGPDRFCLVHNVIGGLQESQAPRHADYAKLISRELTPAETAHVAMMETARRADKGAARDALTGHRVGDGFLKEVTEVLGGPEIPVDPAPPASTSAPAAPVPPVVLPCPHGRPHYGMCPHCMGFAGTPVGTVVATAVPAGMPTVMPAIHFQCPACDAVYPWPIPGLAAELHPKTRRCTRCFAKPDDAEVRFKCPDHTETTWHCRFCVAAELVKGELSPSYFLGPDTTERTGEDVNKAIATLDAFDGAVLYVRVARWQRRLTRV